MTGTASVVTGVCAAVQGAGRPEQPHGVTDGAAGSSRGGRGQHQRLAVCAVVPEVVGEALELQQPTDEVEVRLVELNAVLPRREVVERGVHREALAGVDARIAKHPLDDPHHVGVLEQPHVAPQGEEPQGWGDVEAHEAV